jgi:hypothetical protein
MNAFVGFSERGKDRIEDASGAFIEAAVSAIPIFGGPAAVAVNRAFGSAADRRRDEDIRDLQRLVAELRRDAPIFFQPERLRSFVGRDALLDALGTTISDAGGAATLWGVPGSGRRTVALEFAARGGLQLLRIDGSSRDAMAESLGRSLGSAIASNYASADYVVVDVPDSVLFLIDGVSSPETLQRVGIAPGVKAIVTTSFEANFFNGPSLEVIALDVAETNTLASILVPQSGDSDWSAMHAALHGHALSTAQALNACAAAGMRLDKWIQLFEESPDVMLDAGHAEGSLATAFRVIKNSYDALATRNPGAAWLLALAAALGEGAVRRDVLAQVCDSKIHVIVDATAPHGVGENVDPLAAKILGTLRVPATYQRALVTLRNEGHLRELGPELSSHPLVVKVIRAIVPTRALVETAASTLMTGAQQNDPTVSPRSLISLASLLRIARREKACGFSLYVLEAANVPGFAAFGMWDDARDAADDASRWYERLATIWEEDDPNLQGIAWLIARANSAVHDYVRAIDIFLILSKYRYPVPDGDIILSNHVKDLAALATRANDDRLRDQVRTRIDGLRSLLPANPVVQFNAELADVWWNWAAGQESAALEAITRAYSLEARLPAERRPIARKDLEYVSSMFRSDESTLDGATDALSRLQSLAQDDVPSINELRRWADLTDFAIERDLELAEALTIAIADQIRAHYPLERELTADQLALAGRLALHQAMAVQGGADVLAVIDQQTALGIDLLERAVATYRSLPKNRRRNHASALINLANLHAVRLEFSIALKLAYEARRIDIDDWGKTHPEVERDNAFIRDVRAMRDELQFF